MSGMHVCPAYRLPSVLRTVAVNMCPRGLSSHLRLHCLHCDLSMYIKYIDSVTLSGAYATHVPSCCREPRVAVSLFDTPWKGHHGRQQPRTCREP